MAIVGRSFRGLVDEEVYLVDVKELTQEVFNEKYPGGAQPEEEKVAAEEEVEIELADSALVIEDADFKHPKN